LLGRLAIPLDRLLVILLDAASTVIRQSQVVLRDREPLGGRFAVPARRLGEILVPSSYIVPRLFCAWARPCSAACWYQRTASAGS
jgi:hypothetical protein